MSGDFGLPLRIRKSCNPTGAQPEWRTKKGRPRFGGTMRDAERRKTGPASRKACERLVLRSSGDDWRPVEPLHQNRWLRFGQNRWGRFVPRPIHAQLLSTRNSLRLSIIVTAVHRLDRNKDAPDSGRNST